MNGRFFNDSQRAALFLAADGKCTRCGQDLAPNWHSDHVQPYSHGELVEHKRFADFVATPPLKGLGGDMDLVRRVVKGTPAEDALNRQLEKDGRQGARTDLVSNIHEVERPAGTTKDAALRRLRKDAPELHEQVLAGALSAHAAMVEAGFRPKTFTVRADRPESVARALRKYLTAEQIAELRTLLDEYPEVE